MSRTKFAERPTSELRLRQKAPRRHSSEQIDQIATSIRRFGFYNPIIIDENDYAVIGVARLAAAQKLGLLKVPTVKLSELSEADKRALIIADNRIAEASCWDRELLAIELQELTEIGFDIELTGFSVPEVDLIIKEFSENSDSSDEPVPSPEPGPPISRIGDIWQLGRHRLVCADARDAKAYAAALDGRRVDCVFTDPPYNVPIGGHASVSSHQKEFVMASGEMSDADFTEFLKTFVSHIVSVSRVGAVHFICIDWRHLFEMISAAKDHYGAFLNLCVWNKTNGGMGSLYRSKHELILVLRVGNEGHLNNVQLGKYGRNRTNVWDYAGATSFRDGRLEELSLHPTVKPLPLVIDAIKDVTRRGDLILDPFSGSGTTILAAERCGRTCSAIELDPFYADVTVRRWQDATGEAARLMMHDVAFSEVREQRSELHGATASKRIRSGRR
jgi:DNA modification methylase